ncbi:hypothetical protein [Segatella maculosa]|jgi:hypothetical protein|uniref:hypothetical protein n=1 Tax=Segatella maculosa TaxID=439703 RepID=UPI0023F334C1|nr:hypothetical protein [Segatella maculosa]
MAKLNFEAFRIPTGIRRTDYVVTDAREGVADMIYLNAGGIKAHRLAFKIFESKGETDYDDVEVRMIRENIERMGLGNVIDALNEQLNKQTEETEK